MQQRSCPGQFALVMDEWLERPGVRTSIGQRENIRQGSKEKVISKRSQYRP